MCLSEIRWALHWRFRRTEDSSLGSVSGRVMPLSWVFTPFPCQLCHWVTDSPDPYRSCALLVSNYKQFPKENSSNEVCTAQNQEAKGQDWSFLIYNTRMTISCSISLCWSEENCKLGSITKRWAVYYYFKTTHNLPSSTRERQLEKFSSQFVQLLPVSNILQVPYSRFL